MATNPVNLVDAIAESIPRTARSKSGIVRFGQATSTSLGMGTVDVTISGANVVCHVVANMPIYTNDWVMVLADGNAWVVIGKVQYSDPEVLEGSHGRAGFVYTNYYLGDPFYTGNYGYISLRNIDAQQYQAYFYASAYGENGGGCDVSVDGAIQARYVFSGDGMIQCLKYDPAVAGGAAVYRLLPFAMWSKAIAATFNNAATASTASGFTANRFTAVPNVNTNMVTSSGTVISYVSAVSATSVTVGGRIYDNSPSAVTRDCMTTAVQMLDTGSDGLKRAREPFVAGDDETPEVIEAYCRTPGCHNEEHPVELFVFSHTTAAECSECDQPYTETVPIIERNLRR